MNKHTEGPWIVKRYGVIVGGTEVEYTNGFAKPQIAMVTQHETINTVMRDANARLITAAPELLDVCEDIAAVIDMSNPEHENFTDSCADVVEALCHFEAKLRAIIAKAQS